MPRAKGAATAIDHLVGARLRERRIMLGLTQGELAERLGITHQQLHKYELAINRISAARLFLCARELNTPLEFFFQEEQTLDQPRRRLSLTFSQLFNEIPDDHLQRALVEVTRMLAQSRDGQSQS
jgi:transcriptional regulator with XRE-family HTH domain